MMMSCFVNYREHTLRAGATGAKVWGKTFTLICISVCMGNWIDVVFVLQVCGVLGLSAWRVTRCTGAGV